MIMVEVRWPLQCLPSCILFCWQHHEINLKAMMFHLCIVVAPCAGMVGNRTCASYCLLALA
jgi:hypothetical protein